MLKLGIVDEAARGVVPDASLPGTAVAVGVGGAGRSEGGSGRSDRAAAGAGLSSPGTSGMCARLMEIAMKLRPANAAVAPADATKNPSSSQPRRSPESGG